MEQLNHAIVSAKSVLQLITVKSVREQWLHAQSGEHNSVCYRRYRKVTCVVVKRVPL
jgi:hypothetical protein